MYSRAPSVKIRLLDIHNRYTRRNNLVEAASKVSTRAAGAGGENVQSDDLSGDVLAAGLLVVHDSGSCGKDDVSELTGRKKLGNPLLKLAELDVVAWRDASSLVDASVELDHDLAGAVVINLLELADVTCPIV